MAQINLTPEQEQQMQAVAAEAVEYYNANCPAETKAAIEAMQASMANDENARNEMMTMMTEKFAAADANGDGRLDQAEFDVMIASLEEAGRAKGVFWEQKPGLRSRYYELFISITGEQQGLTAEQYMGCQKLLRGAMQALKGQ